MILSDKGIIENIKNGNIIICPFNIKNLGSNSYDIHMSNYISEYKDEVLDCYNENKVIKSIIPSTGIILKPNKLYLISTLEYTESLSHVPIIEGKSSIGRLGINIHSAAGLGDVGYKNYWTLQVSVIKKVKVYPFMPIGQIIYVTTSDNIINPYYSKKNAKYNKINSKPVGSLFYKNKIDII